MSAAGKRFINEGVLRIAWFIIFASLTYTVRNYTWVVVLFSVVAIYALGSGIVMLAKDRRNHRDHGSRV
ncbi:hypothetical protein A3844_25375 [Paenibacillus helianthi]|uniref:Uncharacterized protein n=1 Tax=Paenibacillus helianthi TaxID=1349432 RepID=A0ABX3EIH5_9BACL|nr:MULTISPECIES: hypothetical protein [Paenibacillus]OKP81785.1 hypothetical protein A3844_25375 [Paenibacillus helianthi]OKP83756.1 hypothetical protein A3848_26115 [Paenibacillus sp. P32E]OKP92301.1 hypothetical protein A3842_02505 [Paenibacillus sp. P3E]